MSWRPTATWARLRRRSEILRQIRGFFAERNVLEVDTPLLSASTVTDPYLESFSTHYQTSDQQQHKLYLQTSPEFAMKRLLSAGSGPIYQMTHAFRNHGEQGRWHNPEFTILEWYRPNFSLSALMDETEALLQLILNCGASQRLSYAALFNQCIDLDPHKATLDQIKKAIAQLSIHLQPADWLNHRDLGLQLITDHLIQQHIDGNRPFFLYDFPTSQAALARIDRGAPSVAKRVEVYYGGLELGNGFHELADPIEQKQRFINDLKIRAQENLPSIPISQYLIDALDSGLPDCSGLALGVDRLVALATQSTSLQEVISFPISRA